MTGIGPVAVRQPRVRDREATEDARIRYSPSILPRYARRSQSLEVLIPILYLKGLSTGDFEEALAALVGKGAPGLSASTIARLKEVWTEEHGHYLAERLPEPERAPPLSRGQAWRPQSAAPLSDRDASNRAADHATIASSRTGHCACSASRASKWMPSAQQ